MLNGAQYSHFFPREISHPDSVRSGVAPAAQPMTPTLRAALDELENEFSAFLQGPGGRDALRPDGLSTDSVNGC
jgi:hypothetical protein